MHWKLPPPTLPHPPSQKIHLVPKTFWRKVGRFCLHYSYHIQHKTTPFGLSKQKLLSAAKQISSNV